MLLSQGALPSSAVVSLRYAPRALPICHKGGFLTEPSRQDSYAEVKWTVPDFENRRWAYADVWPRVRHRHVGIRYLITTALRPCKAGGLHEECANAVRWHTCTDTSCHLGRQYLALPSSECVVRKHLLVWVPIRIGSRRHNQAGAFNRSSRDGKTSSFPPW